MPWLSLIFVLLSVCGALCQDYIFDENSHAVQKGTVDVRVRGIALNEFNPRIHEFRETVAWHLSIYCKRDQSNCWADDKQIRYHDIVIQSVQTAISDVNVRFHVRNRYDYELAGMRNQQVRVAFNNIGDDISQQFGKDVDLVAPEKEGMAPWMIAVIAVCSAVGAALIITIIVLACKQCEARGKRITQQKLIEADLRKEYSLSISPQVDVSKDVEGKENPGYDSDSSDSSLGSQQPGTSRSNSTENSPPPDYNGYTTGQYSVAPPIPVKSALYDNTNL